MSLPRCIVLVTMIILCVETADCQVPEGASGNSVAIRAGYAWGQGEWRRHPYAPVIFFNPNLVIGGDLAFRLSDNFGLAVIGGYSNLSTSEWEDYAQSKGDLVTSSASLGFIAIVLRPFLKNTGSDLVSLDVGPLILFAGGNEKFGSRSFEYDFMSSPKIGGFAAIEYDRYVSENFAIYLRFEAVYVPSAFQYADGRSPNLVLTPVTGGVRVLF